jgi:hypothetical protein
MTPSVIREWDEWLRIMFSRKHLSFSLFSLVWMYAHAKMVELDDGTWENLKDTDSWRATDMGEVEYILNFTSEVNMCTYDASERLRRALQPNSTAKIFAPIILKRKNGDTHLVAGNRRLMLSRANGIRPQCLLLVQ